MIADPIPTELAGGAPPSSAPAPSPSTWQSCELLRRLVRVIDQQGGLPQVAKQTGLAKATLYRWLWREAAPGYAQLCTLARTYPQVFPELRILLDDA